MSSLVGKIVFKAAEPDEIKEIPSALLGLGAAYLTYIGAINRVAQNRSPRPKRIPLKDEADPTRTLNELAIDTNAALGWSDQAVDNSQDCCLPDPLAPRIETNSAAPTPKETSSSTFRTPPSGAGKKCVTFSGV